MARRQTCIPNGHLHVHLPPAVFLLLGNEGTAGCETRKTSCDFIFFAASSLNLINLSFLNSVFLMPMLCVCVRVRVSVRASLSPFTDDEQEPAGECEGSSSREMDGRDDNDEDDDDDEIKS